MKSASSAEMSEDTLRYYHTFPRRRKSADPISVLQSIILHGLVLAPEIVNWEGVTPEIIQRRASFTLLPPCELCAHAEDFGPFSIEVERGVLPLVSATYVPVESGKLINDLGSVQLSIHRIRKLKELAAKVAAENPGTVFDDFGCTAASIHKLLEHLSPDDHQQLLTIISVANLLCRTERPGGEIPFLYYKQREWRLIDSFVAPHWTADVPTEAEIEKLIAIDSEFFGERVPSREQNEGIGIRAQECRMFRNAKDRGVSVLHIARRLICPKDYCGPATAILRDASISLEVAALEETCQNP